MYKTDYLCVVAVILALLPSILFAQAPDTLWTRRYYNPVDRDAGAYGCAVDNLGNIYVVGYSYMIASASYYLTIKYNVAGDTLWSRWYNSPANSYDCAYGCTVDSLGNIYVTGRSNNGTGYADCLTIKYNPSGDTLWSRRYNSPAYEYGAAYGCAVDRSGNLYVTGYSITGSNYAYYLTIKYNTAGDTLWTRRYKGPTSSVDAAKGCTVDSSGNLYVTGISSNGANYDYLTIKYNSAGDTLWTRRYNGPANYDDEAKSCAVDDSGNIYVTGYSDNGTSWDYLTIKYNSAGDTLWTRRYNGPANYDDVAYGCTIDSIGNLYVTGRSCDEEMLSDYLTIKYNASGDTLWTIRYDGPAGYSDRAFGCAIDNGGNLYVTGESQNVSCYFAYLTIKYNTKTGVAGKPEGTRTHSKLYIEQNKPNPFSQHTTISYQLPASGTASLKIYNAAGQLVKTFDMGQQQAGCHQVEWNGSNIPAGVYFYRLTAGNYQATKKLVVLK